MNEHKTAKGYAQYQAKYGPAVLLNLPESYIIGGNNLFACIKGICEGCFRDRYHKWQVKDMQMTS